MTTKIPVELSSTPGIVDNSNATAITIDSSERIGIGSGSPTRTVDINHASTAPDLRLGCDGNDAPMIILDADVSSAGDTVSHLVWRWNNTDIALITGFAGSDTTNKDDGGLSFSTRTSGSATAERMRIDSNGTVQIGSSSAYAAGASVLHLHQPDATSNAYLHITQEDGGATSSDGMSIGVLDGGANASIRLRENGYMNFYTNNTERMRIGSGGQVMINTTSSGNRAFNVLQLVAGETALYVENSGGTITSSTAPLAQLQFSGDADVGDGSKFMEFQRQSDTIGSITALGAAVQYNTSSDRKLKENIVDASSQLNLIKNLQVREFDWKTDSRHDVGLIAQELHEHIPNVVTVGSDEKDVQGHTTPWSIDYGKLTPYLLKAIQEQQEQIEQLKTEIQTLKGE